MLTNQICRTLAPSSNTNSYHVIEKNCTRALLEMRSKLIIFKRICSGMGQSLTLIGYSSELSEMAEADILYHSYDIPHNNQLTPDTVLVFGIY